MKKICLLAIFVFTCFGATVFADNTQPSTTETYRIGGFYLELD